MIETKEGRARPVGTDYDIPDKEEVRCKVCNENGLNRTGLKAVRHFSSNVTNFSCAIPCPNNCKNGLVPIFEGMG